MDKELDFYSFRIGVSVGKLELLDYLGMFPSNDWDLYCDYLYEDVCKYNERLLEILPDKYHGLKLNSSDLIPMKKFILIRNGGSSGSEGDGE